MDDAKTIVFGMVMLFVAGFLAGVLTVGAYAVSSWNRQIVSPSELSAQ